MITIVGNVLVFLSLSSAFIIHLMNRQSKSYLILAGYGTACYAFVSSLLESKGHIDFGLWWLPIVLLGFGEVVRFKNYEEQVATKLKLLSKKQGLHYSFAFFKETDLKDSYIFSADSSTNKTYSTENSLVLVTAVKEDISFELTPDDFDVHIRLISGTADVEHKQYFSKLNASGITVTALTPFKVTATMGTLLEFNIRKR